MCGYVIEERGSERAREGGMEKEGTVVFRLSSFDMVKLMISSSSYSHGGTQRNIVYTYAYNVATIH